ncbi:MAG: hypothetical protein R3C32_14750 [Chloroflexota bacterium]
MLWWSWRRPLRDPRPTLTIVRAAFLVFVGGLVLTSLALMAQTRDILP